MIITAHSGAQDTEPNSREYLNAIKDGKIIADCFEVDVRYRKKIMFLSHNYAFQPKKKIPLEEALFLAKERNMKINLDLKQKGIFEKVQDLVLSLNMDEYVIYTGSTSPKDIASLRAGVVYANASFFKGLQLSHETLGDYKKAIEVLGNKRLIGLNICYKLVEPSFYREAQKKGIHLSMWTVDDGIALSKLCKMPLDNITTHHPDWARKITEVQE